MTNAKRALIAVISAVFVLVMAMPTFATGNIGKVKWGTEGRVKADNVNKKVKISWSDAKNAKWYQIWQKKGSGIWKKRTTVKNSNCKLDVVWGTTYRFKIRGIAGSRKGKFSTVRKVKTKKPPYLPGETKVIKLGCSKEKVKITSAFYDDGTVIRGKTMDGLPYSFGDGEGWLELINLDNQMLVNKDAYRLEYEWGDYIIYSGKVKSSGYQIAWTLDKTKPQKDQADKFGKPANSNKSVQIRGTIKYGDGKKYMPGYTVSTEVRYKDLINKNKKNATIWIRVFKGNKRVADLIEHKA